MPSGCVYEMFSDNAKCNKTYIGSTTGSLRARLASHKYARHPIFTFGDADVRVLEKDIPAGELRQRKSAYMREKRDSLFNSRAAGRSQKHACHQNVDESRTHGRAQYTPKRDGGDGNYRQLNYYKQHAKRILRKTCLKNARARGTLPSKRSLDKYQFTVDELRDLA